LQIKYIKAYYRTHRWCGECVSAPKRDYKKQFQKIQRMKKIWGKMREKPTKKHTKKVENFPPLVISESHHAQNFPAMYVVCCPFLPYEKASFFEIGSLVMMVRHI